MRQVIIIGAGWHAAEICSYINDLTTAGQDVKIVGCVDERKPPGPFEGTKILGDFSALKDYLKKNEKEKFSYITAAGDNQLRESFVKKIKKIEAANLSAWSLIHPSAYMGRENQIGQGSCLTPGSIVTTQVTIGRHCIININASISHDCKIGDFTNINPGTVICGNVKIGKSCFMGAGAIVIDKVTIGNDVVVGAGSVVISDLSDKVRVAGVPAKPINQ